MTTPSFPRRRDFLILAVLYTAFAVYGSLVPLHYHPLEFKEALRRFQAISYLHLGLQSRADWVANILLFIPLGYLWMAVFAVDRRGFVRFLAAPLVWLGAVTLSVGLEFTQLWFPPRTVSQNDIVAEAIGGTAGIALWFLVGWTLTEWMRTYSARTRPKNQVDWLLHAYLLGFVIYSVLPLDLTIRFGDLYQKYQHGRIALVPYSDMAFGWGGIFGLIRDVLVFVPVGVFVATWLTRPERPVRPLLQSVLWGGAFVAAIEISQLLVYSRFTATGDVISGTFGVYLGALIARAWWNKAAGGSDPLPSGSRHWQVWGVLGASLLYCMILLVLFCTPFAMIKDLRQAKARYSDFFDVPFAKLYYGSEFNAVSHVLGRMALFVPLGAMLAYAAFLVRAPRSIRRIFLAGLFVLAAGAAVVIELAQVFFPPRIPDITDVVLSTMGVALGMFLASRILKYYREEDRREHPPGR